MNPLIAITAVWSLTTWALWAKFLVDYFTGNESVFANVCTGTQSQTHVDSPLLVAYIIGNTIVLLFGPMQAFKTPRLHKIIGIIYINGCIFVSLYSVAPRPTINRIIAICPPLHARYIPSLGTNFSHDGNSRLIKSV